MNIFSLHNILYHFVIAIGKEINFKGKNDKPISELLLVVTAPEYNIYEYPLVPQTCYNIRTKDTVKLYQI